MKAFWLVSLLLLSFSLRAQIAPLSDSAQISIFTLGPGDPLFSKFGHSSIRVKDPAQRLDIVFDYGVFDFDEPNFYLKFARGKLKYRLAVGEYERFAYRYRYYNRSMIEQVLNLDSAQRQEVANYLINNYKPQNRYYLYDFFYDNCASRLPDVIKAALDGAVRFPEGMPENPMSFREMTDLYLEHSPWGDLGIDICLGLPADKVPDKQEQMFLPDYVLMYFAQAEVRQKGDWKPLVAKKNEVFIADRPVVRDFPISPFVVFWGFAVITLLVTLWDWRRKKRAKWFDFGFFLVIGLAGIILFALWFLTDHNATHRNLNLLWALPFHAVAAWWLPRKALPIWLKAYFFATLLVNIGLLICWTWLPQLMPGAMYPVVLALAVRSFYLRFS